MHDQCREGNRGRRLPFLTLATIVAFGGWISAVDQPPATSSKAASHTATSSKPYGRLPLSFEENRGQTDAQVKFLARGSGYSLFLTATDAVLKLRNPSHVAHPHKARRETPTFSALKIHLKDANPTPEVAGIDKLPGKSSYFIGRDPKAWHTGIANFGAVRFGGVYPGVDLIYRGEQGRLEYDLEVAPRADASHIKLEIEGARKLALNPARDLVISTGLGEVIQRAPVIYQTIDGHQRSVKGGYVLADAHTVAFKLDAYDHRHPLVIDPLLTYASYLGGTGGDSGVSIAVDQSDGSAWVTGTTTSTDFPISADAFQQTNFGNSDIFMTKVSPDGVALVYSTYAGGHGFDQASGIAVDPSGTAYATGLTMSSDFPMTGGAFQNSLLGTQGAFVVAIDRGGNLFYSTYLGTDSLGAGIAVDSVGEAFVVGTTRSANFPTTGGTFQPNYPGSIGAPTVGFATKLNSIGTGLVFSTFMGVSDGGWPKSVALDSSNNVFISGGTSTGVNFNTQSCAPELCGFVVELDNLGAALEYSVNFPFATLTGIAMDSAGHAHVVGTRGGPLLINLDGEGNPTFVMLNLLGNPTRIAIGKSDNIFVGGVTTSTSLTVTPGAYQSIYGGSGDAFVSVLDPSGFFNLYTTYLGGSGQDSAQGVAVDADENAYVTGNTQSTDFPVTAGVFEDQHPDSNNGLAFVARIVPLLQSPTPTMTVTATIIPTPLPTSQVPPTPTVTRTILPTNTGGATPVGTVTGTIIPTPIPTGQGGGTPTKTATATATATSTATATATATPTPVGTVTIAPTGLNFQKVKVGRTSIRKVARLVNPKKNRAPVTITGIGLQSQLSGFPPTGFAVQSSNLPCLVGSSVAAGKMCRIVVTFTPLKTGPSLDALVISGNFITKTGQPVALVGVGR